MRISINLATRPFADLGPAIKRLRIGMAVLVLLALVLSLGLYAVHSQADQARQRERALDAQIARVTQERRDDQALMDRPDNAELLKQADALNKLFDEKAFSWTLAMENLETVLPGGVQVSTLEPIRAKDGQITLHLRVVGPHDRSVELVRNLEHSRRFLEPRIIGETSESSNLPNQRLEPVSATNRFTFDLLAEYNPPAPDEMRAAAKPGKPSADSRQSPGSATAPANLAPSPGDARRPTRPPYTGPATGGPR